jgi:cell division septal protein FtsQ
LSRLEKLRENRAETPLVYSRTEKEKGESHLKGWLALTFVFILLGSLFYLLFFSELFRVKYVEVNGYQNPEKIKQAAFEQSRGGRSAGNTILFNRNTLKNTLSGDPLLADVYIRKILPNKLIVEITESKPSLIWSTAGDKYLIDERGAVLGPATTEKLPVVFDSADIKVERGDKVASPTFIKFINTIWDGFKPATDVGISKIIIFDLITDVHVLSSSGWTVYLDASKDPKAQLDNLTKVLTEAKKSATKIEYIDLRLDTKLFTSKDGLTGIRTQVNDRSHKI